MSRIGSKFQTLKRQRRKALIPFVTAGYPSLADTKRLIFAFEKAGADLIELGVPFSDPMADGPVIQRASEIALKKGTTLKKVLRLVAAVRKKGSQTPIVLMGYYNPILAYGLKPFARDSARAGVDGVLVVDLPPEESGLLDRELKRREIDLITLLAPTSDSDRIRTVTRKGRGYLYFVSMTGVTGRRLSGLDSIRKKVNQIRRQTKLPIVVGFGIQKPSQAHEISQFSDGVVVGSELIRKLGNNSLSEVIRYFQSVRRAIF